MEGLEADAAEQIGYAKKMLAHSYMSTKSDVSAICKDFAEVPFEAFVVKAAQRAFQVVLAEGDSSSPVNVARVTGLGKQTLYARVQEQRLNQLVEQAQPEAAPIMDPLLLKVHQVAEAVESFPVSDNGALISIHYCLPASEVVLRDNKGPLDLTDATFGDDVTENASPVTLGPN